MLLEIKFFYDHFASTNICGMFTIGHLLYFLVFITTAFFTIYFSRKISDRHYKKLHLIFTILITIMEIIKIVIRVYKQQSPDSWLPLYFCSLFIFAMWLSLFKNNFVKKNGLFVYFPRRHCCIIFI